MYALLLILHSGMRWIVLALAVLAIGRAVVGWSGRREWTNGDRRSGLFFSIAVDLQLLVGLLLTIQSPLIKAALADPGAAMAARELRFFLMEHLPVMLLAVVLVHATSVMARRGKEGASQHRRAAFGYALTLFAILIATPWWRPLLRLVV